MTKNAIITCRQSNRRIGGLGTGAGMQEPGRRATGEAVGSAARAKAPAGETDQGGERWAKRARAQVLEDENRGEVRKQGEKCSAYTVQLISEPDCSL